MSMPDQHYRTPGVPEAGVFCRTGRRRTPAPSVLCLLAALLLFVTGCARIPTSGPVYHYEDGPQATVSSEPIYAPEGPHDGASPQEILQGFLAAGTGVQNDYAVARKFLTADLAARWQPAARTLVHQDEVAFNSGSGEAEAKATVPVSTSIDDRGIATSYTDPEKTQLNPEFERVNGQWRISQIADGTVLTQQQFEQLFRSFPLYFYDSTYTYAVPDVRWFADRSTVTTSLVSALLQGPAPYLQGAVVSAIPEQTQLLRPSVPVSGETAEVDLTGEAVSSASQHSLEQIHTQLRQSLSGISAVSSVRMSVNDRVVETERLDDYQAPEIDPQVPHQQVGVKDGQLVGFEDSSTESLAEAAPVRFPPHHPVMDAEKQAFAYTDEDHRRIGLSTSPEASRELDVPEPLAELSMDPRDYLWAAARSGTVRVLHTEDEASELVMVEASWLEDQHIRSLRVSRDGTRALVVTGEGQESRVWISGIERDDAGRPLRLKDPLRVGATISATQARWMDGATVVVADTEGESVQSVSLSGEISSANGLTDLENISVGNGTEEIYAQTPSDTFLLYGSSWERVETEVQDLSFAG